ncbi:hypothetical protein [Deinococcus sp. Marseille-Q6407]|uniref:hypothetical protein n=1 Tax=Deinococcus sp. Marseille-Q6407 TaxID=2969223 RepID=UPI0021BEC6D7|nr:hypothetical protein [Deinococcus sp. Marseille-Q6407]
MRSTALPAFLLTALLALPGAQAAAPTPAPLAASQTQTSEASAASTSAATTAASEPATAAVTEAPRPATVVKLPAPGFPWGLLGILGLLGLAFPPRPSRQRRVKAKADAAAGPQPGSVPPTTEPEETLLDDPSWEMDTPEDTAEWDAEEWPTEAWDEDEHGPRRMDWAPEEEPEPASPVIPTPAAGRRWRDHSWDEEDWNDLAGEEAADTTTEERPSERLGRRSSGGPDLSRPPRRR